MLPERDGRHQRLAGSQCWIATVFRENCQICQFFGKLVGVRHVLAPWLLCMSGAA